MNLNVLFSTNKATYAPASLRRVPGGAAEAASARIRRLRVALHAPPQTPLPALHAQPRPLLGAAVR